MGNPNRLISLLPPEVREAVQAEMDLEAVADLFGLTKEELEMTAETKKLSTADFKQVSDLLAETELKPNMTVEAARDIWQAVCSGIGSITAAQFRRSSGEYAKELKYVLEFLRKELGQDESVLLGAFLSSGQLSVEGKDSSGIKSGSKLDVFDDAITSRLRNLLGARVNEMRRDTVDCFVDLLAEIVAVKVIRKVQRELSGLDSGNDDLNRRLGLRTA